MVLSTKCEVRESKIAGHGLYARERISKGETVRPRKSAAGAAWPPPRRILLGRPWRLPSRRRRLRLASLAARPRSFLSALPPAQIWVPDADEATRYYHSMEQIKSWSAEEQKHFMNNAYLVGPNTYSGACAVSRERRALPLAAAPRRRARCRFGGSGSSVHVLAPRCLHRDPPPFTTRAAQACASASSLTRASS